MTPAILALGLVLSQAAPAPNPRVIADTGEWRLSREKEITADRGWLAVSGLVWLNEGETTLGSLEGNTVRLADGPKSWGTLVRTGELVQQRSADGQARALTPAEPPFQIGRTWIQLIKRGDRIGVRLWDPQNSRKVAFEGLKWYDDRPAYKVRGRLIRSEVPSTVKIANVIGQVNDYVSPGIVEFELLGRRHQLTPVYETPEQNELFYIFKDQTAGKTTYGAGRFVYSALPDAEGFVVIDFNRAYSPPCAFTDFATCPLPPSQNRLDVAIEAGELDPHKGR